MNRISCSVFFFLIQMYNVRQTITQPNVVRIPLTRIDPRLGNPNREIFEDWIQAWEDSHNLHLASILIGTNVSTSFYMAFDTQAHRPWVFSSDYRICDENSFYMKSHRVYNHVASVTYSGPKEPAPALNRGERTDAGWILGFKSNDVFSIVGTEITLSHEFAEIVKASAERAGMKHDGAIGLRYDTKNPNFATKICDKIRGENKISFYLSRKNLHLNETGAEGHYGELLLCGEDETKYKPGTMRYIRDIKPGYWIIQADNINLRWTSETLGLSSGSNIVIDTTTDMIYGPELNITTLYGYVKAGPITRKSTSKQIPCDSIGQLPLLSFQINSYTYELSGIDYTRELFNPFTKEKVCELLIRNHTLPHWIIGESFMRKYYTVLDMKNNRIGFAISKDIED